MPVSEQTNMPIANLSMLSSRHRYGVVAQLFHWSTVLLVGTAYVLSPGGREERVYAASADGARSLHETVGMLVLALVLLRVAWRAFEPNPEGVPMAAWMKLAARAMHWALYALLIAIPATAVAGAWLEAHPLTLVGIGDIAPMLAPDHALGASLASIHATLGDAIIWLAGLHAAAALLHHYWLGDDTLRSMLPDWRARLSAR
jgi:cytochrome b561